MIDPEPIGLTNTLLPLAGLGACAGVLPWVLLNRESRSHREVAVAIWATAGLMLLIGGAVFALLYSARGVDVGGAIAAAPLATTQFFLGRAGVAALVWGPILVLVWLGLSQRVERLRADDGMTQ